MKPPPPVIHQWPDPTNTPKKTSASSPRPPPLPFYPGARRAEMVTFQPTRRHASLVATLRRPAQLRWGCQRHLVRRRRCLRRDTRVLSKRTGHHLATCSFIGFSRTSPYTCIESAASLHSRRRQFESSSMPKFCARIGCCLYQHARSPFARQ